MQPRCECPETGNPPIYNLDLYIEEEKDGMFHQPNECKGWYMLALYKRNGKDIWLCSCCCLSGDEFVRWGHSKLKETKKC